MRLKTIAAPLDYSDRQGDKLDPATVTQTAWPVARKGGGGKWIGPNGNEGKGLGGESKAEWKEEEGRGWRQRGGVRCAELCST